MPSLNQRAREKLKSASTEATAQCLFSTKRYLNDERFLAKTNRYRFNTTDRISSDIGSNNIRQKHLAEYIASSSLVHLGDGWSYLSRSVQALLRGDANSARHFAYYAELRAAMSVLASQGIGIFNRRHFVIGSSGAVSSIPYRQNTHIAVWELLKYWSSLRRSWDLLSEIITPEGIRLLNWSPPVGFTTFGPIAKSWLTRWGLDLSVTTRDRDARNVSSYRPSALAYKNSEPSLDETISFIRAVWHSLEPGGRAPFATLDLHLLRLALGSTAPAIEKVVGAMGFDQPKETHLVNFFKRVTSPNDLEIIASAGKSSDTHDPGDCFGVMARSILLLRVASGASTDLMFRAGLSEHNFAFWWRELGIRRGLWQAEPEDYSDLWSDVRLALDEVDDLIGVSPDFNFPDLAFDGANAASMLGAGERALIWTLTIRNSLGHISS